MEAELKLAKKTMRETHEKYDETTKRILAKERKLEAAMGSAARAEKRVEDLDKSLSEMARKMANKESSREKVGKREEQYKCQLRKLSMMLKEAEHRADLTEEEQQRMELVIGGMKEEQEIFRRLSKQRQAALSSKT